MAREFSGKEAKSLIQEHRHWLDQLEKYCNYSDKQKDNLRGALSSMFGRGVFASEVSMQLESGAVNDYSSDSTHLINLISRFTKSIPLSQDSHRINNDFRKLIEQNIDALKPAANGLHWLITSKQRKAMASTAYTYLTEAINGTYMWQLRAIEHDIQQLENADSTAVRNGADLSSFRSVLSAAASDFLQRAPGIPAVEHITEKHLALLELTNASDSILEKQRESIRANADLLRSAEVLKMLKNVPIETLAKERSGIRFKSLRDSGYESVADIHAATVFNIAAVNGITEATARQLKSNAKAYMKQALPGMKIRLSTDDRNPTATKLVSSIYEYRQHAETIGAIETLKRDYSHEISRCLSDMQNIKNGVEWLFLSPDNKKRCISSYQYLNQLASGDYARSITRLTQSLKRPLNPLSTQVWHDFEKNSIVYFNILEEIVPGLLGNDDSLYGLPEELAREIQDQSFFPDGLKCTLRRYQEWGVKYILHQERVLLGDKMGLGKTIQAIATMVSLRNTGATHFMVVCPASVLPNWCKEVAEKSKLRVTKIHGAGRMEAFRSWLKTGGAAVTTFETTAHLEMENNAKFDLMVVDEAHYIKNSEARRSISVKKLGEHARRMLFMTGTALENKVDEMIALIQILQPKIASELHNIAFMSAAPQFREKVAPVYYRRKRDDVLTELPDLIESKEWCTLSDKEEAVYEDAVLSKSYADVRRVSWNMDNLNDSCKAKRLKEIIEDAKEDGRKVIVFSFFLDTISKIHALLGDCCTQPINGSVPVQRRQQIIDEFDHAAPGSVLLAQIQSGGTGLNIQSASVVILCEPQLKPSIENQAISRAYRMGQTRNVLVYRLLCEDTIDERITEMLADKQMIFDEFADKSAAAAATAKEDKEIDDKTFGKLIKEEIDRINLKRQSA